MPISYGTFETRRGIWIENEVQDFLYNGGETPFEKEYPLDAPLGVGVRKDFFEPNFERPNVNSETLRELGICKGTMYPLEY